MNGTYLQQSYIKPHYIFTACLGMFYCYVLQQISFLIDIFQDVLRAERFWCRNILRGKIPASCFALHCWLYSSAQSLYFHRMYTEIKRTEAQLLLNNSFFGLFRIHLFFMTVSRIDRECSEKNISVSHLLIYFHCIPVYSLPFSHSPISFSEYSPIIPSPSLLIIQPHSR